MEKENKHTLTDLYQMQSLPLEAKIRMTANRIKGWYDNFDGQVYVSFSGGKDSTVLVDIVQNVCKLTDVPLVYVDTGLEYPEIRDFVKSYGDKVTWLKPEINFKKVIEKYGYPFISKEVSDRVDGARKYLKILTDRQTDRQTDSVPYASHIADFIGIDRRIDKNNKKYLDLKKGIIPSVDKDIPNWWRYQMVTGEIKNEKGERSMYDVSKYIFFLDEDAPVISAKCCSVMKKKPVHKYGKETGRKPITAQMASESRLRTSNWLKNGCNGFNMTSPISNPLSFWTEQDILLYIKTRNIKICSVYGDIVEDTSGTDEVEGQLTFSDLQGFEDMELFDAKRPPLKTTGCNRTGCMFCGYGCHLEKGKGRFEIMKETHPVQYNWIMKPWDEGGLGYKEVIDWINEHGNLNIKY